MELANEQAAVLEKYKFLRYFPATLRHARIDIPDLLTGSAVVFILRHQRAGYLFHNR